jgi:hypothetical protein
MNSRVSQLELRPSPDRLFGEPESSPSLVVNADQVSHRESQASFSSRIPFYLIGLLLAATAIAKLWMLLTDSFADIRGGLPKEILWLSVAFEFWLAFENLRIRDQRVMAVINTVVFGIFAIFASARWLLGYTSCGCSGKLELPVWLFILIDVSLLAWFASTSDRRIRLKKGGRELVTWWRYLSREAQGRLFGLVIFCGLVLALQMPIAAPLRTTILGEPAILATVDIRETLTLDQQSGGTVELRNRSATPATIVGVSRSCRCFDLVEDPISQIIPANGCLLLPLVIKPSKPGSLQERFLLFLDHPKQVRLNIEVVSFVN